MKSKISVFFLLWVLSFNMSRAQYAVGDIPKSLMNGAEAVVRKHSKIFKVENESSAMMHEVYAITILHENAERLGYFKEYYNKFSSIHGIKGALYDKNGKQIKTFKKKDANDVSAVPDGTVFSDSRAKFIPASHNEYPYTVEFEFTKKMTAFLDFPDWCPYWASDVAVQHSEISVSSSESFPIRYMEKNLTEKGGISTDGKTTTYYWFATNLKALPDEDYAAPADSFLPMVLIAPSKFKMQGYRGSFEDWNAYAQWIKKLNEGRGGLDEKTLAEVRSLVKDDKNDREKVEILYKRMQDKVRYISIQVGVGGWQPFEAQFVEDKSYGDCKALTNYMQSMLESVGVKSYYTLVNAGYKAQRMQVDFPSNQFNHVFLAVPLAQDTLWLECTSQQSPVDYLGDFTDDRDVLLIDEQGGKVVRTPVNENNERRRKVKVSLRADGGMKADVTTTYHGALYSDKAYVIRQTEDDQKKIMRARVNVPSASFEGFGFEDKRQGRQSYFVEKAMVNSRAYATKMGSRYILPLNMLSKSGSLGQYHQDRVSPIYIGRDVAYADTLEYEMPEGYVSGFQDEEEAFESDFGSYSYSVKSEKGKVVYQRLFRLKKGVYPKEKYEEFNAFLKKVETADKKKVLLKPKS